MQAGKHGVIVLNPGRRPSLPSRAKSETESDESLDLPESNDPATIRKIVRRQAALASAGRRKATIAATHQKRTGSGRRDAAGSTSAGGRKIKQEAPGLGSALALASLTSAELGTGRIDPFSAHAVDFDVVKDPNVLHSLFNLFMTHVAPLLDLRLPTQDDRRYGRRYSWQTELPHMALSSPPCFWAVMLAAAAQVGARNASDPSSSLMTLGFRHMAIRSINKRLDAPAQNFQNDFGLLIGIAILGSWEKWWGSQEACRTHCDGLKLLQPHFKEDEQPHDLFAQIMSFANTFGSGVKPEPFEETTRVFELEEDANIGFAWISERTYLDQRLVHASIERMASGPSRSKAIQTLASSIMWFNTKPRVRDLVTTKETDKEADRINLEMHIILQATGIAMLNHLAGGPEEAGTNEVDVAGMCDEVADLGRSVSCLPLYDQLLLWAMVTVFALSRHYPDAGLEIIRTVTTRLQIYVLPLDAIETYMKAFVFLNTARAEYHQLLSLIMTDTLDPSAIDVGAHNHSENETPSSCYTQ
ncbi:hypothetical protein AC578_6489 [Pseudocercospora eumusae]|uniref:Transcription factor domain-containing protein n=1 Tax=Pseudocercospora eumusae TaxID=321146 RepID=A0A139HCV0_9PEZI|nr:hypothetical protein AC578_6489 [Pseudocercospora eumusae]